MRVDQKLLPTKVKLRKLQKREYRADTLALSLAERSRTQAYLNVSLMKYFEDNGIRKVNIFTDPEEEAIALQATTSNDGFVIRRTSQRSGTLSAQLRDVMPQGRYVVQPDDSTPKKLIFRKEYTIYRYGKSSLVEPSKSPTKGASK